MKQRNGWRSLVAAVAAVAVWAAAAAPSLATQVAPATTFQLAGVEVFPGATQAGFLGEVSPPGYWIGQVDHTPDQLDQGVTMTVTGGDLVLVSGATSLHASELTGSVIGAALAGCPASASYPASLTLTGVTLDGAGDYTATLSGELTHYFEDVSGNCVPVAASIGGILAIVPVIPVAS